MKEGQVSDPCTRGEKGWARDPLTGKCLKVLGVKVELYQGPKCEPRPTDMKAGNPAFAEAVAAAIRRYHKSDR